VVASPNLTLTITPPGGSPADYTRFLAWSGASSTPTVNQNFGRQGDTAILPLVDAYATTPTFYVPAMSQVKLVDNTISTTLFAGVVTDPALEVTGPNRNEWTLNCTDNTVYADSQVVHGQFIGLTVDQVVVALTQQANCGISAATVANGGFVAPGPQLASFVLNYTTLSGAWRKLAQLAGQVTPFGWYVDQNLALHFFDASSAQPSGVTFTTSPTSSGAGSTTEGHFLLGAQFGYEWDGKSIRNRILVQGANQTVNYGSTSSTPTDTWQADGTQTAWPLRYTVTGSPVLQVGGVTTPVTVVQAGSAGTGTWQIVQNAIGGWSLVNTAGAPAAGVVIKIWYSYQVPVVAQANDYPSQATYNGPNGGVFSEYISDSSLTTVPMAVARAMRERTEYAFAAERITFITDESWIGWVRAGETCTIVNRFIPDAQNSYSWGINDTFIVIANSVTFGEGGYRQCSITAVRI
jgi:hypothetical protein